MRIDEINILVACEESQTVCNRFRERGVRAFSCDLKECSGGHPEWHIAHDVLPLLGGNCEFTTQDGKTHKVVGKWTMIVAHPVCTFLTNTGNRWFNVGRYGEKAIQRQKNRDEAAEFFMQFANADCDHILIENPVGCMSTRWRKPEMVIHPWQFGDEAEKTTCLWAKGLPNLVPTKIVGKGEKVTFASGKSMPKWIADCWSLPAYERSERRSKTFPGIADAIVDQYLAYLLSL